MEQNKNIRALYSDETRGYRTPMEPKAGETVTIRFRTGRDSADRVCLVAQDRDYVMDKAGSDLIFDYYETSVCLNNEAFYYYFDIEMDGMHYTYNRRGVNAERTKRYSFVIVPGFSTPDWAKGAVMYQIFVDRFYNGDPSNDVLNREYSYIKGYSEKVENWDDYPRPMDVRSFYGGDLQGVMDKLDYLKELGVDVIYLNPIFVSPSNHKYDSQDYDHVDPHYGRIIYDPGNVLAPGDLNNAHATRYIHRVTAPENLNASNELFIRLVEEIHARGMRIILDGVFNHCGSFNKWMDRERIYENAPGYEKGAYITKDSPYRNFFKFDKEEWPCNDSYEGWWNHETLPKLNYEESELLEEYILNIGRKWVSAPYHVDGWRLDVAADLGHSNAFNHRFWKRFREAVKEANPEALILAEHYGDAIDWLRGDQWDSVMNYDAFMEPVTWFLTGMEKHSDDYKADMQGDEQSFMGAMEHHMCSFLYPSLLVAMNELSNHDHSRFLTRTNHRVGRVGNLGPDAANRDVCKSVMKEAVIMQMTWPGAPTLYYGDEAGMCGFTDPDNRRTYPWGREDKELLEFHREMIEIHKKYQVLTYGSLKFLYGERNVLSYGRFDEEEQMAVVINNGAARYITIPVWEIGVEDGLEMERLMMSCEEGYDMAAVHYRVKDGKIRVYLPKESGAVFRKCTCVE